jgi:hypothetical protein
VGWRWCDICSRRFYDAEAKELCPVCGVDGTLLVTPDEAQDFIVTRRQGANRRVQTRPAPA